MVGFVSHAADNRYDATMWAGTRYEPRVLGAGWATGINEAGVVVGKFRPTDDGPTERVAQAILWDSVKGTTMLLEDKGWYSEATAINEASVPVGNMAGSTDISSTDVRIVSWDAYTRPA